MATVNDAKAALSTQAAPPTLQTLIEKSAKELGRALPEHMRPERLVRIALTCIRMNPDLGRCTPESFLGALFTSAQIGIEPVGGRAYLLPFNNGRKIGTEWKTIKEVQFVMGYKGVAELFYRHEKAVQLDWGEVRENDEFTYNYGTEARIFHRPKLTGRGKPIAYWVQATLKNGGKPFMVMSLEDCMAHGIQHSKTYDKKKGDFYDSSPWKTSPDAMCLKTVLLQLAKLLPLSVEMQRALTVDESSRDYREGIGDALDLPSTTAWTEESNGHAAQLKDQDIEFGDPPEGAKA